MERKMRERESISLAQTNSYKYGKWTSIGKEKMKGADTHGEDQENAREIARVRDRDSKNSHRSSACLTRR